MQTSSRKPLLALPDPLCAIEVPSFTHTSVVVRLPEIARRTMAENNFPPEVTRRLQELIDGIPAEPVRRLDIPLAPCSQDWDAYISPFLGINWLEIPWFFAEEYFYIRILEATGYFHAGSGRLQDPYASQKKLGLETSRDSIEHLAHQVEAQLDLPIQDRLKGLDALILADLWGNQNDLSMWPVSKGDNGHTGGSASAHLNSGGVPQPILQSAREHVLSDDTELLMNYYAGLEAASTRVDILLDNAGYELAADLAIADYLLTGGLAGEVVMHAKTYPVFVSDALITDIITTIDWLCFSHDEPTRAMAIRLRQELVADRLKLKQHPFWTSPLPAWEMPLSVQDELAGSSLLISKGDANYRRLLGDLHWPLDTAFEQVVSYFQTAILAIRTCKSEIAVGIKKECIPLTSPDWIFNGRYGLIQFARPLDKR